VTKATLKGSFRPFSDRDATARIRKYRSFADGFANGSSRPEAGLKDRPHERAGSARKRSSAEGSVAPKAIVHIRAVVDFRGRSLTGLAQSPFHEQLADQHGHFEPGLTTVGTRTA
jgi:hypothetical protein